MRDLLVRAEATTRAYAEVKKGQSGRERALAGYRWYRRGAEDPYLAAVEEQESKRAEAVAQMASAHRELHSAVSSEGGLLKLLHGISETLEHLEGVAIDATRSPGLSWREISRGLGKADGIAAARAKLIDCMDTIETAIAFAAAE